MHVNVEGKEQASMGRAGSEMDRPRRGARPRGLAAVAGILVIGLLIAGCGGGGGKPPSVANVSTSSTSSSRTSSSSTAQGAGGSALGGGGAASGSGGGLRSGFSIQTGSPQKALKLAECMRANGVANFPDPNGQGVIQGSGIDPTSPHFQAAQKKCSKDLGGGLGTRSPAQIARQQAQALAFSRCMRSHGVSDFPDPQFSAGGGIRIRIQARGGAATDLDPNSPVFQRAQAACGSLLPGKLGGKPAP